MTEPQPPKNFRVEHSDGSVTPLECVYQGPTDVGTHEWVAVITVPLGPGDHVCVDELPAHTSVGVQWWEM